MSNSPHTIPNSAKALRSELDIRERRLEPSKAIPLATTDDPITIIASSHKVKKLLRTWASVRDQTHRKWQLIFVNNSKNSADRIGVRNMFNENILPRSGEMDISYVESRHKNEWLKHVKHDKIALIDDGWCWEAGHLEAMLTYEKLTNKKPFAAYRVLGKVGGWDNSHIVYPDIYYDSYHVGLAIYDRAEMDKHNFVGSNLVNFAINVGKSRNNRKGCTNMPTVVFDYQVRFPTAPNVTLKEQFHRYKRDTFGFRGQDSIDYTE